MVFTQTFIHILFEVLEHIYNCCFEIIFIYISCYNIIIEVMISRVDLLSWVLLLFLLFQ